MNIERAVNYLEENLKNWKDSRPNLSNTDIVEEVDKDYRAIETLLTAYEKEKEKREIAEENHKVLSLDLGKALKELGLYEDTIIADELALEINKRFVSKDKIKAEIEELEKIIEFEKPSYEDTLKYTIEVLQSLLEKE